MTPRRLLGLFLASIWANLLLLFLLLRIGWFSCRCGTRFDWSWSISEWPISLGQQLPVAVRDRQTKNAKWVLPPDLDILLNDISLSPVDWPLISQSQLAHYPHSLTDYRTTFLSFSLSAAGAVVIYILPLLIMSCCEGSALTRHWFLAFCDDCLCSLVLWRIGGKEEEKGKEEYRLDNGRQASGFQWPSPPVDQLNHRWKWISTKFPSGSAADEHSLAQSAGILLANGHWLGQSAWASQLNELFT